MKRILSALAAGALACAFVIAPIAAAFTATPAAAQHVIDPDAVHPGAAELTAPMPAAGDSFASPTAYQPDGQGDIPWGDWVAAAADWIGGIVVLVLLWAFRKLPKVAVDAINMAAGLWGQGRVDKLLEKAVGYGVNATKGAVRGRVLSVPIGNEVLERAFEYAVRHAPRVVEMAGGAIQIREKIIARLDLEEAAAVPTPRPPANEGLVVERVTAPPAPAT